MARVQSIETAQSKYKVGDIVYDTHNCYGIYPYFYKIVGFKGKKTVLLEEMCQAFETKYMSNSPCYLCVPAETKNPAFPYVMDWAHNDKAEGRVYNNIDRFGEYIKINMGFNTHLYLRHWNGEPVQGACD